MEVLSGNFSAMRRSTIRFSFTLLALISICLIGCDRRSQFGMAPVSGTVTIDGKPTADVVVIFSPVSNDTTSIVGPFSSGVTDEQGKFTLKSKRGHLGAVIGSHTVSCQHRAYNPEAVANLKQRIQAAQNRPNHSAENVADLKQQLKKAVNQEMIPERYSKINVSVGFSGLEDYTFELTSE